MSECNDTKSDAEVKNLPPGLQPGGSWLPAIRREVRRVLREELAVSSGEDESDQQRGERIAKTYYAIAEAVRRHLRERE